MRKLLAAMFALVVMLYAVVAIAPRISSSPAETGAPYALECEITQPGVAWVEQCACVHCSPPVANARFVETEIVRDHSICAASEANGACPLANGCIVGNCNHRHGATAYLTDGHLLKLPTVAAVNSEDSINKSCDANTADFSNLEVLGVGV